MDLSSSSVLAKLHGKTLCIVVLKLTISSDETCVSLKNSLAHHLLKHYFGIFLYIYYYNLQA